ncbi:MAG: hypothetical protein CVV33_07195 [Methanomicrobiales archaeon HGW-Methanomicrobiales-4]|nr:MAG: hypothetical protein CVV33_07195 [Methanomicrobiales archaeon HGW-Methanomicrobiales-4]
MECPVCGNDHIHDARDLISRGKGLFSPCPDCDRIIRNKSVPPEDFSSVSCSCGKVFIDDVYVSLYHLLVDSGLLSGTEPLSAVGTPLIDPGMFLRSPPHLPPRTLLVISSVFDKVVADRAYQMIPQISGILTDRGIPPGIGDIRDFSRSVSSEHTLLCGCDVRSDLFPTSKGPIVVYKKQGSAHIEFPHGIDPKIRSVESAIRKMRPELFVDACSGSGTLGLAGMRLGVRHALLNDPWYAAAFFAGFNLLVNKEVIGLDDCRLHTDFNRIRQQLVREEPFPVACGYGPEKSVEVYQGAMNLLSTQISGQKVLTVFDPFDKKQFMQNQSFISFWQRTVGGEVFIP